MAKCKHELRAPDPLRGVWKCVKCHKEVEPFKDQESLASECDHKSWSSKISERTLLPNAEWDYTWEKKCLDCHEVLPRDWGKRGVWAGDVNTEGISNLKFQCTNQECDLPGDRILWAQLEEAPDILPSYADCPVCQSQMDFIPDLELNGTVVGTDNPTYSRAAAESEEKWMQMQIDASKDALKGKTGASPYSKAKIDYEYWEKQGVAKRVSFEESEERKRTMDERNKTLASQTKDKLDKQTIKEYVGRTKN